MTTVEVKIEMKRLDLFIVDRHNNLPEVVFLSDTGVEASKKRLKELDKLLVAAKKEEERLAAIEAEKIAISLELLEDILTDVSNIIDTFEDKFSKLHLHHKGRYMEVLTQLKKIRR